MKYLALAVAFFAMLPTYAQIGIGTSNPTATLEIAAGTSQLPTLELNPQTNPIGTASGQLSVIDDTLYLYDNTRSKWLSVGSSTFTFGHEGALNNTNLEYAGDITNNGPNMAEDGTIVYVALNSSGGNATKNITLTIYNSTRIPLSTHAFQLQGGVLIASDLNINFAEGDYFRVRVDDDGGSDVNDLSMVIWTKWRK